uniref:Zinc/iron-chelating domain-containing protein n=1 Tax=uncultured Thiotrichaceae bacterium TaxID=298394 RepID=A0A6S6T5E0_9GAMM|nr:MAG: Unknown protein [uncultured Thiotrichaceae bacterium]
MKACNSCGKCCIKYGNGRLSTSAEEIDLWEAFRPDVREYVRNGEIWIDPETGKLLELCPWLLKDSDKPVYTCDIYYDRPEDCRYYPVTIEQMVKDDCEMLDAKDLIKPKQAQAALDKLMADSRPATE